MEDLSSLVWLGIVIVWLLSRLIRRAARKSSRKQSSQPRPAASPPTAPPARSAGSPFESKPSFTGRGDKGPPPIVPR